MYFANRHEAGVKLSRKLFKTKSDFSNLIVVAIPRGGVVVAEAISTVLNIPLVVLVIKKLGAPENAELAIGAIGSFGKPVLDRWLIADLKISGDHLKKEVTTKKKEAKAREKYLDIKLIPEKFKGKSAIVVDDGLATGQTAKMAAKILKQFGISKLILAVPCAPASVIFELRREYNLVVCLNVSDEFMSVGQFYRDFSPVEDKEVRKILSKQLTFDN